MLEFTVLFHGLNINSKNFLRVYKLNISFYNFSSEDYIKEFFLYLSMRNPFLPFQIGLGIALVAILTLMIWLAITQGGLL